MTPDSELLAEFARIRSEAAFAELVKRHVNLVYSAALRQANGDAHLAQDVTQTVFTDLARKAHSLASRESLTGWLYTSAHFAAAKIVRGENRRRDREEKFMREPAHESAPAPDWEKIRPALDSAMHELKAADREAILLRYFENRPFVEVGAKLGLNENAARMRVDRALEKLRAAFAERGVVTSSALAAAIAANAVQMAPAGLTATLSTASAVAAGTGAFTLLKIMTATKIKLGISALVVAGAAAALVVQHQAQDKLRADNTALMQQLAQLQTQNESLSNRLAAVGDSKSLRDDQLNELLRLRGEVGGLRKQVSGLEKVQGQNQQLNKQVSSLHQSVVEAQFQQHEKAMFESMDKLGLAQRIFSGEHANQFATNFDQLVSFLPAEFPDKNVKLDDFEFVNVGTARFDWPRMLIFRERNPRQAPDGKTWSRIYGFVDGQVKTATSGDGSFDAWEKENADLPPPANQ